MSLAAGAHGLPGAVAAGALQNMAIGGGPETVEHLQKVKLREHIALIAEFTGVLER